MGAVRGHGGETHFWLLYTSQRDVASKPRRTTNPRGDRSRQSWGRDAAVMPADLPLPTTRQRPAERVNCLV